MLYTFKCRVGCVVNGFVNVRCLIWNWEPNWMANTKFNNDESIKSCAQPMARCDWKYDPPPHDGGCRYNEFGILHITTEFTIPILPSHTQLLKDPISNFQEQLLPLLISRVLHRGSCRCTPPTHAQDTIL